MTNQSHSDRDLKEFPKTWVATVDASPECKTCGKEIKENEMARFEARYYDGGGRRYFTERVYCEQCGEIKGGMIALIKIEKPPSK